MTYILLLYFFIVARLLAKAHRFNANMDDAVSLLHFGFVLRASVRTFVCICEGDFNEIDSVKRVFLAVGRRCEVLWFSVSREVIFYDLIIRRYTSM